MGTGASRRESEVRVVVVQSTDDGRIDARIIRQQYKGNTESSGSPLDSSSTEDITMLQGESTQSQAAVRPGWLPLKDEKSASRSHRERRRQDKASTEINSDHRHPRPAPAANPRRRNNQQQHHLKLESRSGRLTASTVDSDTSSSPNDPRRGSGTSSVNEQGKELLFELFKTFDGQEYTVYLREDGRRFYIDWEDNKWRHFPNEWFQKGKFESLNPDRTANSGASSSMQCGEFIHPTKGKLATFLKQETLNIMYYFDDEAGTWLPIPLTWERHTPTVSKMVEEIQQSCTEWKDEKSIVATLRQCNYSADDSISVFLLTKDDGMLESFKDLRSGQSALVEKLQKRISELETSLDDYQVEKRKLKDRINKLQDEMEDIQEDNKRVKRELEAHKEQQHRQSRISLNQSMGRGRMSLGMTKLIKMKPVVLSLGQETRALKFKLQSTRNLLAKSVRNHNDQMQKLSKALKDILRQYKAQAKDIDEARALYRKEMLQRKLLYNEIQELRGNIRVFCRCRHDDRGSCAPRFQDEDKLFVTTHQGRLKGYEFEKIFPPDTTQEKVFEDTKPIITSCVDGYNVCIIAYGQTGSGKTYTMMGPPENPGVNIRSMEELFRIMRERENTEFTMTVSMVEVYNEAVYDLLVAPNEVHVKLQIQKKGKDVFIPGLNEVEVRSLSDIMKLMAVGENNRTTASTKMNTNSSRSHLLLMLRLTAHDTVSMTTTRGRLTLVDLAGSERISRSEAVGQRLVEAAAINKSLTALGQVFASIRDMALHVPYRNSKLTHLLQPCIGGHSKACVFINISPLQSNIPETVSTLEFGTNTRQVALGKATKQVTKHHPAPP